MQLETPCCRPLYCSYCNMHIPQRYIIALICWAGLILSVAQRVCINVAILSMTYGDNETSTCRGNMSNIDTELPNSHFDWSMGTQGIILSSYFVGMAVFSIPFMMMVDHVDLKYMLVLSVTMGSTANVLIPIFAPLSSWVMMAILRAISAVSQAGIYPCVLVLINAWIPFKYRSGIGATILAGSTLGTLLGIVGTAYIIDWRGRWEPAFYCWAYVGLIWGIFSFFYVYPSPDKHKHITYEELVYLEGQLPTKRKLDIPVGPILLDPSVWALMLNQFGNDFAYYTVITYLPHYNLYVMGMDLSRSAVYAAIPQCGTFVSSVLCGTLVDALWKKRWASLFTIRMVMSAIGTLGTGMFIVIAGYMGCNENRVAASFFCALFCKGAFYAAMKINITFVTFNHTGFVATLVNIAGVFGGILMPYTVTFTIHTNAISEWRTVFWIVFTVSTIGCLVEMIVTRSRRSWWDYPPEHKKRKPPACYRILTGRGLRETSSDTQSESAVDSRISLGAALQSDTTPIKTYA